MLTVKVRFLIDTHLNTGSAEYNVSVGQVLTCVFKDFHVLNGLIELHTLELVDNSIPEQKKIPVFYPTLINTPLFDAAGKEIPLSGGL
jgi:hypothetical protein